ncbi:MAG: 16S rRNA (guanine(527)-N(7))-methyltransferase RsmG [Candidimonas sp.]|nr:MAG: 16S rRNA (guanine(527)-N(7))-methyltransferase RsmG [Candidimonas sp.]TAM26980.1 MAG: 16S rRNA (guanine(527)-N(7))-methyltransferase RsmG [Candidimonas sp.]TAM77263.1 MAG: 16S rRNA (guanine(527)-N(7))-methyltransferase RsmG [Candidimonas sp.]
MAAQPSLIERLDEAARAMGQALDAAQLQALLDYMAQMQRWNKAYNLTALRSDEQILVQHLFDSLSVVGPIRAALGARGAADALIVDVGSGAGLPGVVLAIACPRWQVHCIDAVEKKTAFVRQVSGMLRLPNLHAAHARVEKLEPIQADIVVSRAFASLADFAVLAGRHAADGASLLAMKGHDPQDEQQALAQSTDWRVARVEPLTVPELNAQRCLVWLTRAQGNP